MGIRTEKAQAAATKIVGTVGTVATGAAVVATRATIGIVSKLFVAVYEAGRAAGDAYVATRAAKQAHQVNAQTTTTAEH